MHEYTGWHTGLGILFWAVVFLIIVALIKYVFENRR